MKTLKIILIFFALLQGLNLNAQTPLSGVLTGSAFALHYPGNMNRCEKGQSITFLSTGTIPAGPITISINSLPAQNILNTSLANLVAGDIKQFQEVTIVYDGTEFQMTSASGNSGLTGITNAAGFLENNGTGTLAWVAPGGSVNSVSATAPLSSTGGSNPTISIVSVIPILSGGTNGQNLPAAGAVAYGTGTQYGFTAAGSVGNVLTSTGAGAPTWQNVTGTLSGGTAFYVPKWTSTTTLSSTSLIYDNGTDVGINTGTPGALFDIMGKFQVDNNGNIVKLNSVSTSFPAANLPGALTNNGAGVLSWGQINLTNNVTGILPLNNGGTGSALAVVNGGIVFSSATGMGISAAGISGQVLTSNGAGTPSWTTPGAAGSTVWSLTGNAGTSAASNFIGTTDANNLVFKVNGIRSGLIDQTASESTLLGYEAGKLVTTGAHNTALGYQALYSNATQNDNIALGYQSLYSVTAGWNNAAIGSGALYANIGGYDNIAIGGGSLGANTNGDASVSIGAGALQANNGGGYNTAIGENVLIANTSGMNNTGSGAYALDNNTIGGMNVSSGYFSLRYNVAGSNATALGTQAMYNANSTSTAFTNYNVAVGYQAYYGSGTASANTGNYNTAIGYQTLWSNSSGGSNSATGVTALYSNTTGNFNTAYGYNSLFTNTTGSNNTALGNEANVGSGNLINATAIGANASVGASNSLVLGSINGLNGATSNVNVGIGVTAPLQVLHVVGTERVSTLASGASGAMVTSNANGDMGFTNFTGNSSQVLLGNNTFGAVPGAIGGVGTVNYITKWTSPSTLSSTSMLFDDGTNVGIGTTIPVNKLDVYNPSTTGSAGNFQITNAGSPNAAFYAITNGTGNAGNFQINNVNSGEAAIQATTTGLGQGIYVNNTGTGVGSVAGYFQNSTAGGSIANALYATTNGSGAAGYFNNSSAAGAGLIVNGGNTGIGLTAPASLLHSAGLISIGIPSGGLGGAAANTGSLLFYNSTNTNTLTVKSGTTTANYTLILPPAQGAVGSFLEDDGSGNLSWITGGAPNWSLTGNTGTAPATNFLGTIDATDFVVRTDDIERMRVQSGGNIGIGTTTPAFALELASNASNALALSFYGNPPVFIGRRADGTMAAPTATTSGNGLLDIGGRGYTGAAFTTADAVQIKFFAGEAWSATANGTYMTFSTTPNTTTTLTEQMRIDNAGNVGIGTTTTAATLDVETTTAGSTIAKLNTSSAGNASVYIGNSTTHMNLGVGATLLNPYIWSANGNFSIGSDVATPSIFVQGMSAGNVGIGTSAPAAQLDVTGAAASLGGTAKSATFNTMAGALGTALNNTLTLANIGFTSTNQTSLGFLAKRIAAGTSWTSTSIGLVYDVDATTAVNGSQLWLTPGSNVGIGVAAPLATLSVSGGTSQAYNGNGLQSIVNMTTGAGAATDNQLEFGVVNGNYAWIQAVEPGTTNLALILNPGGGQVGIGTTNPDQTLSVNGNADKTGGGAWAAFSDRRMKKDIAGFSDGLSIIKQINPMTFKYNGLGGYKADGKQYVGVIAQDMQKLAPYMIEVKRKKLNPTDSTDTDLLMYDASALPYIIVNAMKEQQKMIEDLQKENSVLKQSNSSYHAEVDQLKAEFEELKIKLGVQPAKVSVEK